MTNAKEDHPRLQITINPSAPEELQRIGQQYWQYKSDLDNMKWMFPQTRLDHELWHGKPEIAAGAGATATLLGYTCSACNGPLHLPRRRELKTFFTSGGQAQCRNCTTDFQRQVGRALDPEFHAHRQALAERNRQKAAREQEAQRQQEELELERWTALHEIQQPHAHRTLGQRAAHASPTAQQGALLWAQSDTPQDSAWGRDLLMAAWKEGLLELSDHAELSDFGWDRDNPTKVVGLSGPHAYPFGSILPTLNELIRNRLHAVVLPHIKTSDATTEVTLTLDTAVVSKAENHAHANGSALSEVIEAAINAYLPQET